MGTARTHRPGESDPSLLGATPATYSYNDALLAGKMTRAELEAIRAELATGEADEVRVTRPVGDAVDLAQVTRQINAGDYPGALALAERALERSPDDVAARRYVDLCRRMLGRIYLGALGERTAVPRLAVSAGRLRELSLDRWAAFVVSRIDGVSTIDDLVDVAGLPRLDTLRILYELVEQRVVSVVRRA